MGLHKVGSLILNPSQFKALHNLVTDANAQTNVDTMDDYDSHETYCEEAEMRLTWYRENQ